ncbi:MAG: phosphatidylserine/phosphatidylglycerophosphate/cardiolipin synthase family protein, partial [Myxococcales bacterium]|nr:phosphatidylserine/phosphatidylglycerophosphate/cardiolipin synthase family protein [Myxococcales bacterium]
ETGDNDVLFLMDGEEFFEELRMRFEEVRQAAPDTLTYIRLAYWMIEETTTLGDHGYFEDPGHRLLSYIDRVIRAGHNVDIIVWCPAKQHRHGMGAEMAEVNSAFGRAVRAVDQAAAAAGPQVGRARVFLEAYEGDVGASNHQKIAIFSIAGVRTVYVGGLNLSNHYFAPADHSGGMHWHDAAVRLRGPATDDVEKEWMRRWARTSEVSGYWGWSAWGWGSEVIARDFSYQASQTVRTRALRVPENKTRQPPQAAARQVKIALTRSVGSTRYRHIRDAIIERILAANQYVYFENYQFADPELVQAIIRRHTMCRLAGVALRVVILVPMQGGACAYMTRRAWLHMLLSFRTLANAPMWRTLWYDLGGGEVQVQAAACALAQVNDTYDAADPWGVTRRWIDGDDFTYRLAAGGGNVRVPLDKITRVDGDFHFYSAYNMGGGDIYKHAKIAIFDDRYMACGTSNWSYRSMQYDGEISAIIDSPAIAQGALRRLLDHFNPPRGGLAPLTPANIQAEAVANLRAWDGHIPVRLAALGGAGWILVPMNHFSIHPNIALSAAKPDIKEAPNFTWF